MTVTIRLNPNFKADVLKAAEEKLGVKIVDREDALCRCGHNRSSHTFNPLVSGRACVELWAGEPVTSNKVPVCPCREFVGV